MSFLVSELIGDRELPVAVRRDASVTKALQIMLDRDYSQLPVVDDRERPLGLITSDSVLAAMQNFDVDLDKLLVSHATVKAHQFRMDNELADLLDTVRDDAAALVVDAEGKLTSIVTSYDTTEYYRRRAEDMMLVEDIESAIKDHISAAFTDLGTGQIDESALTDVIRDVTDRQKAQRGRFLAAVRKYMQLTAGNQGHLDDGALDSAFTILADKPEPKEFEDLTLSDYIQILLHGSRDSYRAQVFNLETGAMLHLLEGVRDTRNDLAHFRRAITPEQRQQLHFCSEWLDRYPAPVTWPIMVDLPRLAEPSVVVVANAESMAHTASDDLEEIEPTEEVIEATESRYGPLGRFLRNQPEDTNRARMTFKEVEQILGSPLPESARRHRAWWANDATAHVQSQQWLEAGWRVSTINLPEEVVVFARTAERQQMYINFFSALTRELAAGAPFKIKENTPKGQSWFWIVGLPDTGPQRAILAYAFAIRSRFRVELYIETGVLETNKQIFDILHAQKEAIEAELGEALSWERINDRRASRIALYHDGVITDDEPNLVQLRQWAVDTMIRFHAAIAPRANAALIDVLHGV